MKRSLQPCSLLLCSAVMSFILTECMLRYSQASHVFTGNLRAAVQSQCTVARAQGAQDFPRVIRANALVLLDGLPHIVQQVLESGPAGPTRAKLMNLNSGRRFVQTWKCGSAIKYVATESQPATYSYPDETDNCFVFFGNEDGEEFRVDRDLLVGASQWLVEGAEVDLKLFQGKVLSFGYRGDVIATVADVRDTSDKRQLTKRVKQYTKQRLMTLTNGEKVMGPRYIKAGDRVIINPETSEFVQRL